MHKLDGYPYDYHRLLYTFRVKSRTKDVGIYRPRHALAILRRHQGVAAGRRRRLRTTAAQSRLLTREAVTEQAASLRSEGRTVVFTNGVFDLLHPGHVRYLQQARALGDALIVGLNSDASVRRNKGPDRPINPEAERAELLAGLDVSMRSSCSTRTRRPQIIKAVQPDILVKGADWPADQIVGRDTVEARGGRVERITVEQGHSTTAIVEKVRRSQG